MSEIEVFMVFAVDVDESSTRVVETIGGSRQLVTDIKVDFTRLMETLDGCGYHGPSHIDLSEWVGRTDGAILKSFDISQDTQPIITMTGVRDVVAGGRPRYLGTVQCLGSADKFVKGGFNLGVNFKTKIDISTLKWRLAGPNIKNAHYKIIEQYNFLEELSNV